MKRVISVFMVICMLFSLMPAMATAEESPETSAEQEELYAVEIPEGLEEDQAEELSIENTVHEETVPEEAVNLPAEGTANEEQTAQNLFEEDFSTEPEQVTSVEAQVPEEPVTDSVPEKPTQVPAVEEMIVEESAEETVVEELFQDESVAEPAEEAALAEENGGETADGGTLPEELAEDKEDSGEESTQEDAQKVFDTEETLSTVSASDAAQTSSDWLLPTIDDKLITQDTYKDKIQLLVFYRGTSQCGNSNNLIYSLSKAWWTVNSAIQVIAVESDQCSKETTASYVASYAPEAKNIVFAYNGSDLMWSIVSETKLSSGSITFGVCAILKNGAVVDCWQGEYSANGCEDKLRQYVDLGTDPSMKQIKVEGQLKQTEARKMLSMINKFRTSTTEAWYWNDDDTTKTVFNTNSSNTLGTLSYDYDLEKVAMKRAQELAVLYDHLRPTGEYWDSLYVNGTNSWGENIAWNDEMLGWTAADVFTAWREDNDKYWGQGHRRNMLNSRFTTVGFGCFTVGDCTYWTQEFGYAQSGAAATAAEDGYSETQIVYDPDFIAEYTEGWPYAVTPLTPVDTQSTPTPTLTPTPTSTPTPTPTPSPSPDPTPKPAQAVISKISYGKNGVTVKWNAVKDATKYQVSKRVKGGTWKTVKTTTKLSYTDSDVESGTTYQYRVRAKNGSVNGAWSKTKSVTYIGAPTLSSVNITKTAVKLKLIKASGASQTQIWRRVKTSAGWGNWKKLASVTGTGYTDKTAKSGKTYQYRLRSVDANGKAVNTYSSIKKITFIKAPVLAKPTVAKKAITLNWKKVPGAAKYRVFRKGPGDNSWVALKDQTKTEFVDRTAKKGQKYSYSVRCITKDGAKYSSVLSTAKTVTAK